MSNVTEKDFTIFKISVDASITTMSQQLTIIASRILNSMSENDVKEAIELIRKDVSDRVVAINKQLLALRQDIDKL